MRLLSLLGLSLLGMNVAENRNALVPPVNDKLFPGVKETSLILESRNGGLDEVNNLLKSPGIDINTKEKSGITALMVAADEGHAEVVSLLIDVSGIDVNAKNSNGYTAFDLFDFSKSDHAEILELFLHHRVTRKNIESLPSEIVQLALNNLIEKGEKSSLRHAKIIGFDIGSRLEEISIYGQEYSPVQASTINTAAVVVSNVISRENSSKEGNLRLSI